MFFPLKIDYGVDSFRIENHIVAERQDAVTAARREYLDARYSHNWLNMSTIEPEIWRILELYPQETLIILSGMN